MNSQPSSILRKQFAPRFRLTTLVFLLIASTYPAIPQTENATDNVISTKIPSEPNLQVWESLFGIGTGGEVQVQFKDGRSLTGILASLDETSFAISSKNKKRTSLYSLNDVKSVKRPSHALRNATYAVGAAAGILGGLAAAGAIEEGLDKAACGNANSTCLNVGGLARPAQSR
jgi:small nuclear ribonucleoprotein (snRNP)-like protein